MKFKPNTNLKHSVYEYIKRRMPSEQIEGLELLGSDELIKFIINNSNFLSSTNDVFGSNISESEFITIDWVESSNGIRVNSLAVSKGISDDQIIPIFPNEFDNGLHAISSYIMSQYNISTKDDLLSLYKLNNELSITNPIYESRLLLISNSTDFYGLVNGFIITVLFKIMDNHKWRGDANWLDTAKMLGIPLFLKLNYVIDLLCHVLGINNYFGSNDEEVMETVFKTYNYDDIIARGIFNASDIVKSVRGIDYLRVRVKEGQPFGSYSSVDLRNQAEALGIKFYNNTATVHLNGKWHPSSSHMLFSGNKPNNHVTGNNFSVNEVGRARIIGVSAEYYGDTGLTADYDTITGSLRLFDEPNPNTIRLAVSQILGAINHEAVINVKALTDGQSYYLKLSGLRLKLAIEVPSNKSKMHDDISTLSLLLNSKKLSTITKSNSKTTVNADIVSFIRPVLEIKPIINIGDENNVEFNRLWKDSSAWKRSNHYYLVSSLKGDKSDVNNNFQIRFRGGAFTISVSNTVFDDDMSLLRSILHSWYGQFQSNYDLPEILDLTDDQTSLINKFLDYSLSQINETELFSMSSRLIITNFEIINQIFSGLVDGDVESTLTINGDEIKLVDYLDMTIPLSSKINDGDKELNISNYDQIKELVEEKNIKSWSELINLSNSIDDIPEPTNEDELREILATNNDSIICSDFISSTILRDTASYINNNLDKYANSIVLSAGIFDGVKPSDLMGLYSSNIDHIYSTFKAQLDNVNINEFTSSIFDKFDSSRSTLIAGVKNSLSQEFMGRFTEKINIEGTVVENLSTRVSSNIIIKQYVASEVSKLSSLRNYSSIFNKFSKGVDINDPVVTDAIYNEELLLSTIDVTGLYSTETGLTLLLNKAGTVAAHAVSGTVDFISKNALDFLVTSTNVVTYLFKLASKYLHDGISFITNLSKDGTSFKINDDYVLETLDIPLASGMISTPTILWGNSDILSNGNVLALPLSSTSRLLLIRDPLDGNSLHYRLYAGINSRSVDNDSIKYFINDSQLTSEFTDTGLGFVNIGGTDLHISKSTLIEGNTKLTIRLDVGNCIQSSSQLDRQLKLSCFSPLVNITDVSSSHTTVGNNTASVIPTSFTNNSVSLDLSTLSLLDSDYIDIDLSLGLSTSIDISDYALLPLYSIELEDSLSTVNNVITDGDFAKRLILSSNNALNLFNFLSHVYFGFGSISFSLNPKTGGEIDSILKQVRLDRSFQAGIYNYSNTLAAVGATTAMGAVLGSFVPFIGTAIGAGIGAVGGLIFSLVQDNKQLIRERKIEIINDIIRPGHLASIISYMYNPDKTVNAIYDKVIMTSGLNSSVLKDIYVLDLIDNSLYLLINSGALFDYSSQLTIGNVNSDLKRVLLPTYSEIPSSKYSIKTKEDQMGDVLGMVKTLTVILGLAVSVYIGVKLGSSLVKFSSNLVSKKFAKYKTKKMMNNVVRSNLEAFELSDDNKLLESIKDGAGTLDLMGLATVLAGVFNTDISTAYNLLTRSLLGFVNDPSNKSF